MLEINKCIFGHFYCDNSSASFNSTYPRKIDLLLKYDDGKKVELSSNEWKKARVSNDVALSQQTKNLKLNAAIINNNQAKYSSRLNQLLAIDFIGAFGYIYKLKKLDDVFIAETIGVLIIPKDYSCFELFKGTLDHSS